MKEQEKLLADIYSELIDPQSFYGTFEEALAKYEAKRKEIQVIEDAGGKARKEDYQELTKNLRGIVQGGNDWKEKLLKHFGSDANKPENKAILDKLDALKAALLACEKCVADNLSTTPPKSGGGGPMGFEDWEVNLAKCIYPDAVGETGAIKTGIANNACGPESILACVGAAAMDIALNYAFKWVEVNFLDENKQNNYAITDFDNIWKAQDKYEVFSSAAIACAVALVPFPTGTTKEKILATAVGAFAGGAVALITDAGDQYEVLPESMSVGDKLSSIDWKQSFRKAGTSAFITGVSSGIALWAIDHPRFRTFGAKVKSLGYDKIKALLKKSELSEETIEAFCRRFGVQMVGNRLFKSIDAFKDAIAKGDNVFYVGKHSDITPRPTGLNGIAESHHGVNSVWMKEKYVNYGAGNNAPTVYMLKNPNHNATRGEFNKWAAEIRAKQGTSAIDYSKVTDQDILGLANRQFDVADVPQIVRDEYFKLWNEYKLTLTKK